MFTASHVWGELVKVEGPLGWDFPPSPQTHATCQGLNCCYSFLFYSTELGSKATAFATHKMRWKTNHEAGRKETRKEMQRYITVDGSQYIPFLKPPCMTETLVNAGCKAVNDRRSSGPPICLQFCCHCSPLSRLQLHIICLINRWSNITKHSLKPRNVTDY